MDYTPRANKAEWHLTYRCDLSCACCNRACFLPAQTPDMTLDDAREFCRQADAMRWKPRIMLIGGEPTLHPEFLRFVELAAEFNPGNVEVWSNGHRQRAKALLASVRASGLAKVIEGTQKADSVAHGVFDIFLAPADFNDCREPCGTHSRCTEPDCGISVDHEGYTVCCMGGAIDGFLRLGARTKRLADLWDYAFADRQTRMLCQNCGQHLGVDGQRISVSTIVRGTLMSPTWASAAARAIGGVA
jgi:hypothetical protein